MEKQFNMLLNDYRDNYIQYKTNGNEHYKSSYESAQSAIENLFSSMHNLPAKSNDISDLQMKLIHENDNVIGSEMRKPQTSFAEQTGHTVQYIVIGCLGAVTLLLVTKPWTFFGISY
jgi:2-methylcitrate dehydratase PrpD